MWEFRFLSILCIPDGASFEKNGRDTTTTQTVRRGQSRGTKDTREGSGGAGGSHGFQICTCCRNRRQYTQAARIDFDKRAWRIAPSSCVRVYFLCKIRSKSCARTVTGWLDNLYCIKYSLFFPPLSIKRNIYAIPDNRCAQFLLEAFFTIFEARTLSKYFDQRKLS